MFIDTMKDSINILTALGALMDISKHPEDIPKKFVNYVKDKFNILNFNQKETEEKPEKVELEETKPITLSELLINLQKSLLETETMTQIKDKVLEGYHEISNVQV
ncbi:MAG: flagellar hook-basal body complex protein FliE [Buchnera aphidicola (Schlechtendalia chinensis)]